MPLRDLFSALLVTLIWGLNFVVIKVGLAHFPPLFFSGLRFFLVAFPAVLLVPRRGVPWRVILLAGLTLGVFQFGLLFLGMSLGFPAGLSALVLQTQVVFTFLLSALILREKPSSRQVTGCLTALAGIALMGAAIPGQPLQTSFGAGFLLILTSALVFAFFNILVRRAGRIDMLSLIVWMSLVPPLPMLGFSLAFENGQMAALTSLDLSSVLALAYISYLSTIVAYGTWARLLSRHTPNLVAPFTLLVPLIAIASARLFLDERLDARQQWAGLVVLLGVAWAVLPFRRIRLFLSRLRSGQATDSSA